MSSDGSYAGELARFETAMSNLRLDARALAALLFDARGRILAGMDASDSLDLTAFGREVAAQLESPESVARLLRADAQLLLGGVAARSHVDLVAGRAVLFVLYPADVSPGLVRLRVQRTLPELQETFDSMLARAGSDAAFDRDFPRIAAAA